MSHIMSWCLNTDTIPAAYTEESVNWMFKARDAGEWQFIFAERALHAFHPTDMHGMTRRKKHVLVKCLSKSLSVAGITAPMARVITKMGAAIGERGVHDAPYDNATWASEDFPRRVDVGDKGFVAWEAEHRSMMRYTAAVVSPNAMQCTTHNDRQQLHNALFAFPTHGSTKLPDKRVMEAYSAMTEDFRVPANAEIITTAYCDYVATLAESGNEAQAMEAAKIADPLWMVLHPVCDGPFRKAYLKTCEYMAKTGCLPVKAMLRFAMCCMSHCTEGANKIINTWCTVALGTTQALALFERYVPSSYEMRTITPTLTRHDTTCTKQFVRLYARLASSKIAGKAFSRATLRYIVGISFVMYMCDTAGSQPGNAATSTASRHCELPLASIARTIGDFVDIVSDTENGLVGLGATAIFLLFRYCPPSFLHIDNMSGTIKDIVLNRVDEGGSRLREAVNNMKPIVKSADDVGRLVRIAVLRNSNLSDKDVRALCRWYTDATFEYTTAAIHAAVQRFVQGYMQDHGHTPSGKDIHEGTIRMEGMMSNTVARLDALARLIREAEAERKFTCIPNHELAVRWCCELYITAVKFDIRKPTKTHHAVIMVAILQNAMPLAARIFSRIGSGEFNPHHTIQDYKELRRTAWIDTLVHGLHSHLQS